MSEAKSLLDFISSKDDAKPFLETVDLESFPVCLEFRFGYRFTSNPYKLQISCRR